MIMTFAVIFPSPGTARVRDSCSGHLTQIRIRFARSSSLFAASVFSAFPSRSSALASSESIRFLLIRLGAGRVRLASGREGREAIDDFETRLSIRQFLFFDLRRKRVWILLVEDFL